MPRNASPLSNPKNRLREIRTRQKLSQEALGAMIGVGNSFISKLELGKADIDIDLLTKLGGALGVDPAELLLGGAKPTRGITRAVPVCRVVEAGEWADRHPPDVSYDILVPADPAWEKDVLEAAEVRGHSMDAIYPPGSIVVYRKMIEFDRDITPGRRYVVEIQRRDGKVESTLKQVERSRDGRLWLTPQSLDPVFKTSIPLESRGGESVSVIGRVVFSLRRE